MNFSHAGVHGLATYTIVSLACFIGQILPNSLVLLFEGPADTPHSMYEHITPDEAAGCPEGTVPKIEAYSGSIDISNEVKISKSRVEVLKYITDRWCKKLRFVPSVIRIDPLSQVRPTTDRGRIMIRYNLTSMTRSPRNDYQERPVQSRWNVFRWMAPLLPKRFSGRSLSHTQSLRQCL